MLIEILIAIAWVAAIVVGLCYVGVTQIMSDTGRELSRIGGMAAFAVYGICMISVIMLASVDKMLL